MTTTNLYISYVFSGITAEQITDVIQNYELLGTVDRVDLVPAKNQSAGKAHNMAFVHMRTWFNNEHAQKTLLAIRAGEKHKIYYESFTKTTTGREPFWTVIQNTKAKAKPYPMVRSERDPGSPSMPPLIPIEEEEVLTPLGEVALNVDDIVTPPRNTSTMPTQPPRLVRQSAVYLPRHLYRNISSSSTVYEGEGDDFETSVRKLNDAFELENETQSLVHESYVKKVEAENAKLHARLRSALWFSEKRFATPFVEYVSDILLSFDQLVQKYGPLTWSTEHFDYTDADGFVRRIADESANIELCKHMDIWRWDFVNESNMNENEKRLHNSYLRLKL
jgi:hypothetical protein